MASRTIALIEAVDNEFFGTSTLRETAIDVLSQLAGRDTEGNLTDTRWPRNS